MNLGLTKTSKEGAGKNKRSEKIDDSDDELKDFNPQVCIRHIQSESDDDE